ncbi:MAG: hypothetical protein IJ532_06650 [Alphaproteobacteria bacterium]|nr:hypothetical protein [Alphaproteobacteria bacterium]
MKFKKYQDIMPSNRTNFTMVYNYAARTLTQIETILKQAYGNPLPDRPKRRLERMRHKMEQMVARYKQCEADLKKEYIEKKKRI